MDVRLDYGEGHTEERIGIETLQSIKERCFIPVIFYTAVPHLVRDLENQVIRVVEKTQGLECLLEVIRETLNTRLPSINRALVRHLKKVQREYMWDFVSVHWEELADRSDPTTLAYLLARRLALSLSESGVCELIQDLGGSPEKTGEKVHPVKYYIMPPVVNKPLAGDLYRGSVDGQDGYWVLLTPTCDIWQDKAERILLAFCRPLEDSKEYRKWLDRLPDPSKDVDNEFRKLLADGQSERYMFLPGAIKLPHLIVDFQQLVSVPYEQLTQMERVASLDSPFAGKLLTRFVRYYGRQGAPDLDVDVITELLRNQLCCTEAATAKEE
ncbi:MAG: response regulator [Firmicutes bacterium]|nr:response regulator [Bacillota bacterium]